MAEFEDPFLAANLAAFGNNLLQQSRWPDAEQLLRDCLRIRTKMLPDDWTRFYAMSMLGESLLGQRRYSEAEPLVVPGYEGMKDRESKVPSVHKPRLFDAALRVVRLYERWGKATQAKSWKERLDLADLPPDVFDQP